MKFVTFAATLATVHSIFIVEHNDSIAEHDNYSDQFRIYFAPDQATLSITPTRSKNGILYKYDMSASIPKLRLVQKLIAESPFNRYVVYVTDQNSTIYKIGQKGKGYRIAVKSLIDNSINSMGLEINTSSSLPFEIAENLETAQNSEFVITNTIVQACSSSEVLAENIGLVNIADGDIISHNVNSESVAISFFGNRTDIEGVPISASQILINLPLIDSETNLLYTGDIFIEKRNPSL